MAATSHIRDAVARKEPARIGMVYRFNLGERIAHWNHALSFLVLLVTGGALVFRGISALLDREMLMMFGQIHRVAGALFTVVTIPVLYFMTRKSAGEWLRSSFKFDRDDVTFLARFARDFFGLKVQLPDQGKFNAGEKINSVLQILGWPVMVITGWLLVFKEAIPRGLAVWVLPIHSFTALALGAAVLGHIYLAVGHPHSRPGLSGMVSGWVPAKWARAHYRKWYDTLQKGNQ